MEKRSFTRTITTDNGIHYHLPPGEYNRVGNYTRQQTLDAALATANVTGKQSRILVSEATSRQWHNSETVK